jgi:hypothetical protein
MSADPHSWLHIVAGLVLFLVLGVNAIRKWRSSRLR